MVIIGLEQELYISTQVSNVSLAESKTIQKVVVQERTTDCVILVHKSTHNPLASNADRIESHQ